MEELLSSIEDRAVVLEAEIRLITERNKRVELDKAWETSLTRRLSIVLLTYATTLLVFYLIGVKDYLLNAITPTLGYFLSTYSMPFVKRLWVGGMR